MMSPEKIAIVTGSNRGIGRAICRGLCEQFPGKVYLTSRDEAEGLRSVATLNELGLNPFYHKLDVNDIDSINEFSTHIKEKHGGVDVLVNNAGIGFRFHDASRKVLNTNYFGTLRVSESFIPLLKQNGRIVNVTCSAGHLSKIPSQEIRNRFSDSNLTVAALNDLINEYIRLTEDKSDMCDIIKTWGVSDYVIAKVGVCALTRILQHTLDQETPSRNILVNCVHPGYVYSAKAEVTDVIAPLNLVLEPHTLRGKFVWSNGTVIDWLAPSIPWDF